LVGFSDQYLPVGPDIILFIVYTCILGILTTGVLLCVFSVSELLSRSCMKFGLIFGIAVDTFTDLELSNLCGLTIWI